MGGSNLIHNHTPTSNFTTINPLLSFRISITSYKEQLPQRNRRRHKLTISMNAMSTIFLFVLGLQVMCGIQAADKDIESENDNCMWFGTAPFCRGECPAGTKLVRYDGSGDGVTCLTGYKAYCCTTH